MRIGIFDGESASRGVNAVVESARRAAIDGFDSFWIPQIFGLDSIGVLSVVGREVPGLSELGTAVVPTWPRHPTALAAQALCAADATGSRFTLGIGLSHEIVIDRMFGIPWDRPAGHMEEYLEVLMPLLRKGKVSFRGERFSVVLPMDVPNDPPLRVPVMVAALGPRMLEIAGRLADGTATWMTGAKTIATHVAPRIRQAAAAAGNPPPRIGVGLPFCVTSDEKGARELAAERYAVYGSLPSYRAMLDREGVAGPAELAIVGDLAYVRDQVGRIEEAGATDLIADVFGTDAEVSATRELLLSCIATKP
ncbi:MAG: TIGR03564 family F420-dependent LLM class oxidoreductase [Acidimicrobiia bacterium]